MLQVDKIEFSTTMPKGDVVQYLVSKRGWTQPTMSDGKVIPFRAHKTYDGYMLECLIESESRSGRTCVRVFAIRKRMDGIKRSNIIAILDEIGITDD